MALASRLGSHRLKLLVSAFAFAPNTGSEPGVGWRWAIELAKDHDVTVITDVTRRPLVEKAACDFPQRLKVVYFRPSWLLRVPLNSSTAPLLYVMWQFGLLRFARLLHQQEQFDAALHITYSVFRHPSFLGFLGIPFMFGPLGGGEDAPLRLKKSIKGKEKVKEVLRSIANKLALFDPFLWIAYAKATLILVSTEQTRTALPWPYRSRAVVFPNLGAEAFERSAPSTRREGDPLELLFAGRLLGWKGAHLAIRALARAKKEKVEARLTIVGKGPYEGELRKLASQLNVETSLRWLGHISQETLFELYSSSHAFLFPSLHDSGGTVILEAQANGLPIICLDIGGPATLVSKESSVVVPTSHATEESVVEDLARAITTLASDEALRQRMGAASVAHARDMRWENRVPQALSLLAQATVNSATKRGVKS